MIDLRKLVSIAILLLLLAACGRGREEEATPAEAAPAAPAATSAPEATSAPAADAPATEATALPADATAAPAPSSSDPQTAVTNAMAAQLAGGPYRATTTVDADGTITEMVAEVIPPDSLHIIIGGGNMEMILLDQTLWSKSGEAAWTQMGSPDMANAIFDSMQGYIDGATLTNVQYVGEEPVFAKQADVYTFTSSLGEGEDAVTSDVKLWVSKATGRPIRMESTGTAMGVTTHVVQAIEYDDTITIEPPAQ